MDGRFDDALIGLAEKHKGIEDILYTVMSFYERHTDVFHTQEGDGQKGWPEGKAEETFRKQFNFFQGRYLSRAQPHLLAPKRGVAGAGGSVSSTASAAPGAAAAAAPRAGEAATGASGPPAAATGGGATRAAVPNGVGASPLEGGDPGQWEKNQEKGPGYSWNQSTQELNIEICVEKCCASDLKVDLSSRKICVKRKGEIVVEGRLHDKISCEDSTWHLDSGKQVVLSLEKVKQAFWPSLFEV